MLKPSPGRRIPLLLAAAVFVLVCLLAGWWWKQGDVRSGSVVQVAANKVTGTVAPDVHLVPPVGLVAPGSRLPEMPLVSVEDRYAKLPVMAQREEPPANEPRVRWTVTKLVHDDSFKYPLLRVVERWQLGPKGPVRTRQSAMVADHVMVKLKPNQRIEPLLERFSKLHPEVRRRLPASNVWIISFEDADLDTVPRALEELRRAGDIITIVEPDYVAHVSAVPNDSSFSSLWGMHNTGQLGGTADVDIDAPEAWNLNTGSRSVLVGVIDTGLDYTHPDIAANVWKNPREIASNGIDDDGNGYIDDVRGWDFYNNDSNPMDDHGHGTHVSGTLGAVGNNGSGVAGVCWKVSIAGLKFLSAGGSGSSSDAIEAIHYATSIGVMLTSNSWSGGEYEQLLKDAIDDANAHGVLFIAAAGNETNNNDASPSYPSSYTSGNIIAVAAVTRAGGMAWFSSYGLTSVDIGAPGLDILSLMPGGGLTTMSGTSMATPHVSGVCALLKSFKPVLTSTEIKAIVLGTAKPLSSLAGKCSTGGLLNARLALDMANDLSVSPGDLFVAAGEVGGVVAPSSRAYTVRNQSNAVASWTSSSAQPWLALYPAMGTLAPGQAMTVTAQLSPTVTNLPMGINNGSFSIVSTTTGRVFTRAVAVEITQAVVSNDTLDADPSWTMSGQWQYGQPLGGGGSAHGNSDPSTGATGSKVIGMNLGGDYLPQPAGPHYATTQPLDLSMFSSTKLRFQSWLNCDYQPYCSVMVEVSTDGTNWTSLLTNAGAGEIAESAWTRYEVDLSSYADRRGAVQVRFGYQTTNGVYAYSGWNLDDIQILGTPVQRLTLTAPVLAQEGDGPLTATVSVVPVRSTPLFVELSSSDEEQASVPFSVTIPANQASATFPITPENDTMLDGSQTVTIAAWANTYQSASAILTMEDNESAPLTVVIPPSTTEGDAPITGTVSVPTPVNREVRVTLGASDVSEISVPAEVVLPKDATQVSFPITVIDDGEIDGAQPATVTAMVPHWTTGQSSLVVNDNEVRGLSVELFAGFAENQGTVSQAGRVRISGTLTTDLNVTLTSADPAHLTVPASLVIVAGQTEEFFDVTLINDPLTTGQLAINVTAQATTFTSGVGVATVYDLQSVAVAAQPSPANLATQVSPEADLSWTTVQGGGTPPTSYDVYLGESAVLGGEQLLGNTAISTWALPRLARGGTYFWRVDSRNGADIVTGPVWRFTVAPVGALDHFTWSGVPSTTPVETTFTATITAKDEFDDTVTAYAGTATLATQSGASSLVVTEVDYDNVGAVEITNVGPATVDLTGVTISIFNDWSWPVPWSVVQLPSGSMQPGEVMTIRGGGTAGGSYPTFYLGYNMVFTPTSRIAATIEDSAGHLLDFMCVGAPANQLDATAADWAGNAVAVAGAAGNAYLRTLSEDSNSAADWAVGSPSIGTLNSSLLLPFPGTGPALPVVPTSATFASGTWTGSVRIRQPHPRARLLASEPSGKQGMSGSVSVTSLGKLSLVPLITSTSEGIGTLANAMLVTLPSVAASSVQLQIVSLDTSEIASSTFTIPAGQQFGAVPLTVVNDAVLDGSQVVSYEVYTPGYQGVNGSITVHDNESTTLSVTCPPSASELDDGSPLEGTVSIPMPAGESVTVTLTSSKPAEASVPASVVIAAGATTATFAINVHDDDYVDGPQAVQFTASVQNWTTGQAIMNVEDEEARWMSVEVPFNVTESTGSVAGSILLAGKATQALTIALTSSAPSQMTVPATVTVPAGASSVSFNATPVDDTLRDGAADVIVSATLATFTSIDAAVQVRDNDVHHFTQTIIASPQVEGALIPWTIEAFDVNDEKLDAVAGPLTLSITTSGGAVAYSPTTAGPFVAGSWAAPMRVLVPASDVRFTLTSSSASPAVFIQSNAFNVNMGPRIAVAPTSLSANVLQGRSVQRTFTITNNGASFLSWWAQPVVSSTLSTSPSFVQVHSPGAPVMYAAPEIPGSTGTETLASHNELAAVRDSLDASYTRVTDLIPDRFNFLEGDVGTFIDEGGQSTFAVGNVLSSSLMQPGVALDYSDDVIALTDTLGSGGRYFTRKLPGLFVLAADVNGLSWLQAAGGLGAASAGTVDGVMLRTHRNGKDYKVLVKRVFNGGKPSVNHLFIIPDVGSVSHQFAQDSAFDDHRATGLQGVRRVYYLMCTCTGGRYLANAEATAIAEAFLDIAAGPSWISLSDTWSALAAGASKTVTVTLDSMAIPLGVKAGGVTVVSNDALHTPSQVALTLTVDQSVPVVAAEPAFTGGTGNTLSWTNLGVGIEYEVQRDPTGTFPSPASSGWIGGTSHTFSALTHAITYSYRVHSRLADDNTWTSEWSPTVSSTQDAQPPVVVFAIPSGVFTGLSAYAMLGTSTDLAGVASLQFVPAVGAPIHATTSNQFANWGVSLPGLVLGGNAFTVTARDTAVPANTSNVSWSLTLLDPNAPAGSNGVSPLLAAAMNVDPNSANALKQTSAVTGQVVNSGDGKNYLTVSFRRRVVPAGFSYFIETSPDLKVWTNAGAAAVLISTVPEGVTELRTYRIQPALSDAVMNFVRVRVQVD